MTPQEFFEKHPDITGSSKHYAKAMLLAGSSEEEVLKLTGKVAKVDAARVLDLSCPRCRDIMAQVALKANRRALYCKKDGITIPLPI